jgi:hypothetical protein
MHERYCPIMLFGDLLHMLDGRKQGFPSHLGDVSGTRLRPRLRVPESWRAPGHSKLYGAGPIGTHLVEFNYEASV